jgi:hypothetical protein
MSQSFIFKSAIDLNGLNICTYLWASQDFSMDTKISLCLARIFILSSYPKSKLLTLRSEHSGRLKCVCRPKRNSKLRYEVTPRSSRVASLRDSHLTRLEVDDMSDAKTSSLTSSRSAAVVTPGLKKKKKKTRDILQIRYEHRCVIAWPTRWQNAAPG